MIADFIQAYGVGGLRAQRLGTLPLLARVYWYTVEFGLLRQPEGLRIYGAGIVSSRTESVFALDDESPHRIGFDLERVMRTRYRIDDFQECYFVLESFDELLQLAHIDFAPFYQRVQQAGELEPGTVLPEDRIYTRGNGRYHAARRADDRHAEQSCFAVQIVAVTGRQRQHQEFATIDSETAPGGFGRHGDGLRLAVGSYRDAMLARSMIHSCRDLHLLPQRFMR